MQLALNDIWRKSHLWAQARREAQLAILVGDILADCNDSKRQAERLSRWERYLTNAPPGSAQSEIPERLNLKG